MGAVPSGRPKIPRHTARGNYRVRSERTSRKLHYCGRSYPAPDRRGVAGTKRRVAAAAPLHAGRGDGGARRSRRRRAEADPMRGMITAIGMASAPTRQTAASTASMPNARSRRRGQSPQPRSGAPKAQGLTPAPRTAARSTAPSRATHDPSERNTPRLAGSGPPAATPRISTTLTDVTRDDAAPGDGANRESLGRTVAAAAARWRSRLTMAVGGRGRTRPPHPILRYVDSGFRYLRKILGDRRSGCRQRRAGHRSQRGT